MWMMGVPTATFTAVDGFDYTIKDIKDIPSYGIFTALKIKSNDTLDEIASRANIYGEYGESNSYAIFEANVVKLMDEKFSLANVKELKIPVIV